MQYYSGLQSAGTVRRGAFTLIELLVVIVILGIATVIVVPMLANTDDLKLNAATRQMVAAMLYAQTNAIATQQTHQIVFDTAANSYEVQKQNPDSSFSIAMHPIEKTDYRIDFDTAPGLKNVVVNAVDFDGTGIVRFDRMGAPYNGNGNALTDGSVTIAVPDFSNTITIEPVTGRIRI
jgi:prepilin-type N-terminal cleavage/methylation domain-containing protein